MPQSSKIGTWVRAIARSAVAACAVLALGAVADAGPQGYATRVQTIRAGVVILASAKANPGAAPTSVAPFALYELDADSTVKPAGWSFSNPHAPGVVTPDIKARWAAVTGTAGPAVGSPITKREAAYWEVLLNQANDEALDDYDLLVVNPTAGASLTSAERNRLARFVDKGGVLWIDLGGGVGVDAVNNFPLPFAPLATGNGGLLADFTQPVLNRPNALSWQDMTTLSSGTGLGMIVPAIPPSIQTLYPNVGQDFRSLGAVSSINGVQTIGLGRIGDGMVVVTTEGLTIMLGGPGLSNTYSAPQPPGLTAQGAAAAKFAVNVASLASEHNQEGGGSRKANSEPVDIGAPLLRTFTAEGAAAPNPSAQPAIFKGVIVATVGDRVIAYDAKPSSDLDGDGDPDDGMRDYSIGDTKDRLWSSISLPTPLSSPVCVEIPNGSNVPRDQVLVVDGQGSLHIFDLFPGLQATGRIIGSDNQAEVSYSPIAPPRGGASSFTAKATPNAPTVHEGVAFMTDNVAGTPEIGRIWAVDLHSNSNLLAGYQVGGGATDVLPPLANGATIGYIPITDNTGGMDSVLYAPFASTSTTRPGLISVWVGAKGEKPAAVDDSSGSYLEVTTRAGRSGLEVVGLGISLVDRNGNPISAASMSNLFSGQVSESAPGVLRYTYNSGQTLASVNVDPNAGVRVDYRIDWTQTGIAQLAVRGRLGFPQVGGEVVGPIVMSPKGTLYAAVAAYPGGAFGTGALFTLREEPRGQFKMVGRWDLYDAHNITINQTQQVPQPAVLQDNDGVNNLIPILRGTLGGFQFAGPPAVRDGVLYQAVTARLAGGFPIPKTLLLAFNAEPGQSEIRISGLPDSFQLVQLDPARSSGFNLVTGTPTQQIYSVMRSGSDFTYDSEHGVIRLESLMSGSNGDVQNSLSESLPVILRVPGQADVILQPENPTRSGATASTHWSQLLWYTVVQGLDARDVSVSQPGVGFHTLVTGDTAFVAGQSLALDVLSGKPFSQWTPHGMLYAVNTQISPNDPFLHGTPNRPWLKQLYVLDPTGGNPDILWPQGKGVASGSDYLVRLGQTVLGSSTTAFGIAGGEGTLLAWAGAPGGTGLYGFDRSDVLVADEGRVAKFDSSGNPLWVATALADSGNTGGGATANVVPFVRPTRVYGIGQHDILAVDTGSNKILQFDESGYLKRVLSEMTLDLSNASHVAYRPEGWKADEPLGFDAPRDVITFFDYRTPAQNPFLAAQPLEYWVHYLIADSGNKRLVELVDRYAANPATRQVGAPLSILGSPQLGLLYWHSPASVSGKQFGYNSVSRVFLQDQNGSRYVYVAGVSSTTTSKVDVGLDVPQGLAPREANDGTGGVVIFDPANPQTVSVVSQIVLPDTSAAKMYYSAEDLRLWNAPAGFYDSNDLSTLAENTDAQKLRKAQLLNERSSVPRQLGGVNAVTAKVSLIGGTPTLTIMVADNTGAYELARAVQPAGNATPDPWPVQWMMTNRAYRAMRRIGGVLSGTSPLDFRAMYAKRLDSGDVLLVNGYYGALLNGAQFGGEVVQVDGDIDPNVNGVSGFNPGKVNLGFDVLSLHFELPPIEGTRTLALPVFADRD